MPIDEREADDEEFARRLPEALGAAADAFPPHSRELVPAAVRRGRRLRLLRRVRVAGAGVLTAAVIGGGLLGSGLLGGPPGVGRLGGADGTAGPAASAIPSRPPAPARSAPPAPPVTAARMIATLERLLPSGGTFSAASGRGTDDSGFVGSPFAQVTYADARGGVSAVDVDISRSAPQTVRSQQQSGCPPVEARPYDVCVKGKLPDGALYVADKSFTYPGSDSGQRRWTLDLWTRTGARVSLEEFGGGGEKATGANGLPLLSMDELIAVADSPRWAKAIAAVPAPPPATGVAVPSPHPSGASSTLMTAALRALLPPGFRLRDPNSGPGLLQVVLDDGHGLNVLEVDDQTGMGRLLASAMACGDGEPHCHSEILPDGTRIRTSTETGRSGATSRIVDTLRPDGRRVLVRESNSYAQNGPVTRPTPALTVAQLRGIALSARWGE